MPIWVEAGDFLDRWRHSESFVFYEYETPVPQGDWIIRGTDSPSFTLEAWQGVTGMIAALSESDWKGLFEVGAELVVGIVDFLLLEGSFLGAVAEGVGDGALVCGQFLA